MTTSPASPDATNHAGASSFTQDDETIPKRESGTRYEILKSLQNRGYLEVIASKATLRIDDVRERLLRRLWLLECVRNYFTDDCGVRQAKYEQFVSGDINCSRIAEDQDVRQITHEFTQRYPGWTPVMVYSDFLSTLFEKPVDTMSPPSDKRKNVAVDRGEALKQYEASKFIKKLEDNYVAHIKSQEYPEVGR